MPREYYVYPNGNQIPISGACEYATQLPMSVSDATDVYTAINAKADSSDLATVATSGSYNDLSDKPTIPDISTKVSKSGDTMSGQLKFSNNDVANIEVPSRSLSYINKEGNAGIHGLKTYNTASWYPVVCQDTKGGGHWQIGNYNDESLQLVYATKTNRDGNINTTQRFSLTPWGDNNDHSATLAHSGNVGTGDSNGQVKIAGTNVSVKGLGSAAYINADTSATANTVVRRTNDKYVYATYYNSAIGAENINSYTSNVVFKDQNNWFRCTSLANFKSWFGTANAATKSSYTGNYSSGGTSGNLRFHAQTSVLSASGSGVQLVTAAALNTIFGVSNCGAGNTAVFVSNGDGNAWGGHFDGCNYIGSGTPSWWATMNTSVTGTVRINWLAIYFG